MYTEFGVLNFVFGVKLIPPLEEGTVHQSNYAWACEGMIWVKLLCRKPQTILATPDPSRILFLNNL